VVSAGYNLKLGGGLTFFLDTPVSSTGTNPEQAVLSGIMTFTWPLAEIGPSYLGLLLGTQLFYWSSTDSWGYTSSNFELTMSIGASLRFDPLDHPANRTLYPEYTRSYDY
jgi:hypothetical protein